VIRRCMATREFVLFLVLVVLFAALSIFVDGFFNASGLLRQSRYWVATGMVAIPMTFIIATAGIDLSVGSMVALCGVVLGLLCRDCGWNVWPAACAAVLVGGLAGTLNGAVGSYLGIPPLVVTLATMALFRGLAMGLSKAESLQGFPAAFIWLGKGNVLAFLDNRSAYLPVSVIVLLLFYVAGWLIMRRTWVGRFTECIGENETAAAFAAIDVRRLKLGLYAGCGFMCGMASLFHTALYEAAKADTAGGMELEAIACVVVGGTRISGGQGTVLGSLLGLLIIGILRHGLVMANVKQQYVVIYVGLLLVATAVLNEWMARRRGVKS